MRLPKHMLEKLKYYEHYTEREKYTHDYYDVFILHFRGWFRRKKIFRLKRSTWATDDGHINHSSTEIAQELNQQLNDWVDSTFKKQTVVNTEDNVVYLNNGDEK